MNRARRLLRLAGTALQAIGLVGLGFAAIAFTTPISSPPLAAIGEFFFYTWFIFLIVGYTCLRFARGVA